MHPVHSEETWLVTGGAGFIGANFVLAARGLNAARIVNLDCLTYAGNLKNLAALADDPGHLFVRGDIANRELVGSLLGGTSAPGGGAFCRREPRGPLHLWSPGLHGNQRHGDLSPPRGGEAILGGPAGGQAGGVPLPARFHGRGVRVAGAGRPAVLPRPPRTPPTAPMPRPRRPATTWCGPTTTPTASPPSSPTAPTITAPASFRKSSSPS